MYRTLCADAGARDAERVIGLAAFLSIYLAGFVIGHVDKASAMTWFAVVGFVVTLTMTYLSVWVE